MKFFDSSTWQINSGDVIPGDVNPDKEMFNSLMSSFKDDMFVIINGYIEDCPKISFDAIFMIFNVINHIPHYHLREFIKQLSIRTKYKSKIYFDMYNSECINTKPPNIINKTLSNGSDLTIQPSLINNILNLNYFINNKLVEEMKLYIHNKDNLNKLLTEYGFESVFKEILGREGDPYFLEITSENKLI